MGRSLPTPRLVGIEGAKNGSEQLKLPCRSGLQAGPPGALLPLPGPGGRAVLAYLSSCGETATSARDRVQEESGDFAKPFEQQRPQERYFLLGADRPVAPLSWQRGLESCSWKELVWGVCGCV